MKGYQKDFPLSLSKTKIDGLNEKFNLSNVAERAAYFKAKVGPEIEKLKQYFQHNTFIAYWLGKKNSGKGTYSKLMMEIFGRDKIGHISIGDIVRSAHRSMSDQNKKQEILDYLKKNYRGYISIDQAISSLLGRNTRSLLPTEFILALVKREIDKMPRKTLFIDGFPREMDQISYSLYFRDLINYRNDVDIFIVIDIPEPVISERMKYRVVCPKCYAPRNLKLFPTQEVGYDQEKKEFYLRCDSPKCQNARMGIKEGDNLGIEAIRKRLELDDKLIKKVFSLHGIPKILLRNAIPVKQTKNLVDDYEITPEYSYNLANKISPPFKFQGSDEESEEGSYNLANKISLPFKFQGSDEESEEGSYNLANKISLPFKFQGSDEESEEGSYNLANKISPPFKFQGSDEESEEGSYKMDSKNAVKILEKPWIIKDDQGRKAYSLLASPVVVSLIKQLTRILVKKE
ncbi:nucleoside monophosphate kinase [Patescibacteria group bacterium]|nr:nucleoside monophosphate kinase [Patescibacteria group bacterium]